MSELNNTPHTQSDATSPEQPGDTPPVQAAIQTEMLSQQAEAASVRDVSTRRQTILSVVIVLLLTPLTLIINEQIGPGSFYLPSMLMVIYAMVPFFVSFESSRPTAREITLLAVMCALAAVSRIAFYWLPGFKPMAGIIAIAGIALGAREGFLVGSLSMFASNFFFTQGSWTPWQMLAYGLIGFAAGLLADRGVIPRENLSRKQLLALCCGAFVFMMVVVGPVLDTSTLFFMISRITPESLIAIYTASIPANAMQGAATFLTLLLVCNPLLAMIARVKLKYGIT